MTKLKTLTEVQQELIIKHLAWAENIAKRYFAIGKSKGQCPDELISSAYFGLCEAAGKYISERGKFTTFAYQYVKGQILRDINKIKVHDDISDHENVLRADAVDDNDGRFEMVKLAMENLSPREKKVVCWKFGMSEEPLDNSTIAQVMHLSPIKVRNIYKSAIRKMKKICA